MTSAEQQSSESSKCRVNAARARVGVGDIARPPSRGVRFPTPKRQHCRDSRDSLGTVLSESVAMVSLSAPLGSRSVS